METIKLKPIPIIQKKETVNEYVQKNDIRKNCDKMANDVLSQGDLQKYSQDNEAESDNSAPYLSQELIQKIKIKQRVLEDCKDKILSKMKANELKNKEDQLWKTAETIKTIFSTQKSSIAPLEDIVAKLEDTERGVYISKGNIGRNL